MPVGRGDGDPHPRAFCTLPSFARIKRPRWRPIGLNDRHLRSNGKIGDCEQSNYIVSVKFSLILTAAASFLNLNSSAAGLQFNRALFPSHL